jgi:hypothetical protein
MGHVDDRDPLIETFLRDLDAVRKRLDQAHEWLSNGKTSVSAAALAERAKHLCQQASKCDDPSDLHDLLAQAKKCLRDLENLLGLH